MTQISNNKFLKLEEYIMFLFFIKVHIIKSNMRSFIGYINNAVIKFLIYFMSDMHIARQIMDIISKVILFIYTFTSTYISRSSSFFVTAI
jgi:hypothetical protein